MKYLIIMGCIAAVMAAMQPGAGGDAAMYARTAIAADPWRTGSLADGSLYSYPPTSLGWLALWRVAAWRWVHTVLCGACLGVWAWACVALARGPLGAVAIALWGPWVWRALVLGNYAPIGLGFVSASVVLLQRERPGWSALLVSITTCIKPMDFWFWWPLAAARAPRAIAYAAGIGAAAALAATCALGTWVWGSWWVRFKWHAPIRALIVPGYYFAPATLWLCAWLGEREQHDHDERLGEGALQQ